jgi:hypothetical protein
MSRSQITAVLVFSFVVIGVLYSRHHEPAIEAPALAKNVASTNVAPTTTEATNARQPPTLAPVPSAIPTTSETSAADIRFDSRTTAMCHRLLLQKHFMGTPSCDAVKADDTVGQSHCRSRLAAVDARLQAIAARTAACPESLMHASGYYQALRDAALGGDANAQRCFIQGYFENLDGPERISKAEETEYNALAKKFIDTLMERGDWSVPRWLGRIRDGAEDSLLGRAYPIGPTNPETVYKMKLLLVLGNQGGNDGVEDPKEIVDLWRNKKRLTDEQFQDAELWAQTMYSQHFAGSQENAALRLTDFCDAARHDAPP